MEEWQPYRMNPFVNKKILVDAIGILLLALVVVVGYKLSPLLLAKADVSVQPDAACDLQRGPCGASLPGGGRLQFAISPRPIPMVAPIELEVSISGRDAEAAEVDFAGVAMNMGLNRVQLVAQGGGRFTGQASLPVCISGGMDWQATVFVDSGRERIGVPFRFSSKAG